VLILQEVYVASRTSTTDALTRLSVENTPLEAAAQKN